MTLHRRSFLLSSGAWLAGSPAAWPSDVTCAREPAASAPVAHDSAFDPWLEIRADHLARNAAEVSRAAGGRPIMAVVKNNGYGLGVVNVARVLAPLTGIGGFAVVKLQEAVTLRDAGIKTPILLMAPFDDRDLEEMHARDIMPMVYTAVGERLARLAARSQRAVRLHVCVDTGLGRVGVPFRDAPALVRGLAGQRGVAIEGVMMTFTEDRAFDQEQLRRFESTTGELARSGIKLGLRHAASTYTFFQHDNAWLDMVRPGMALYGIYPEPVFRSSKRLALNPAVALRARVAYVKRLPAGDSAGYERAFMAKEDTWIATLPVGHADGWPRVAAKGAKVRIGGTLYPVVASVSASHTIVHIGREPAVRAGDVATLFDWEDGSRPEDVAAACGASVYDLTMHLGGHLARRMV